MRCVGGFGYDAPHLLVERLRNGPDLTHREIADKLGISPTCVGNDETWKEATEKIRTVMKETTLDRLLDYLPPRNAGRAV